MGVAMIGCEVIASLHLDTKMGPVACFSQNITKGVVSCHNITSTLTSDGMMSKGVKGIVRAKCTLGSLGCAHTKPPFYGNLMDRCIRCRPSTCDDRTDSQEDACGAETESNHAQSAVEEVSNSKLNMQVSNVLDSSFWETRDAERRE